MSDLFKNYCSLMPAFTRIAMMCHIDGIVRAIIERQLEKRLGRPLTNWDRGVYKLEHANRERYTDTNEGIDQWLQHLIDWKTIHNFVWDK